MTLTRAHWIRLGVLFAAAAAASVAAWQWQLGLERARFERSLADLKGYSRAELAKQWRDRDDLPAVKWSPVENADPALAVIPRSGHMFQDAIYILYRGDRPSAILAVTGIGTWWNGSRLSSGTKPGTKDAGDRTEMVRLMAEYRAAQKPGAPAIASTDHAVQVAKELVD
ncbi:MAG: hypothetical protein ABFD69_00225 [Candidatus Sumerlaeia bacterium]